MALTPAANVALVRLVLRMRGDVPLQVGPLVEACVADGAALHLLAARRRSCVAVAHLWRGLHDRRRRGLLRARRERRRPR